MDHFCVGIRLASQKLGPGIICVLVGTLLAVSSSARADRAAPGAVLEIDRREFKNCPPVEGAETLSTGERVEFPICYSSARSIALEGTVDLELLNEKLRPFGLLGVPFQKGRALVRWYFLEYPKTTIGPYREVFIGAVTSTTPKRVGLLQLLRMWSGMPGTAPKDAGIFELNLWVDQPRAMAVGNELLGTAKKLAEIPIDLQKLPVNEVGFEDGTGFTGFQLKSAPGVFGREVFGNNLDFLLYTQGGWGARTRFKGASFKAKWKKLGRSFRNPTLEALDFQPQAVLFAPSYDGILSLPKSKY